MGRSMSRKGNSGDNAACEGFFGRMKTEMHYGIRWETKAALKGAIENYLVFYNEERIKASLGGLSIKEHRDKLAKCPAFSPKPLLSYNPKCIWINFGIRLCTSKA